MSRNGRGRGIVPVDYVNARTQDAKRTAETIASQRLIGVQPITTAASAGYVQAEAQELIDKLNEVIRALLSDLPTNANS